MIRERLADATDEFGQNPLRESNATKITPPAVLINLEMVAQMRERRRQLQALEAWAASRQESGVTR